MIVITVKMNNKNDGYVKLKLIIKDSIFIFTWSVFTYLEKYTVEPPQPHSSTDRSLCSSVQYNCTVASSNMGILHSTN